MNAFEFHQEKKKFLQSPPASIPSDLIFPLTMDEDSAVREGAAEVLVHGRHPAILPFLVQSLDEAVPEKRTFWIHLIRDTGEPGAAIPLIPYLKTEDHRLQFVVATALVALGRPAIQLAANEIRTFPPRHRISIIHAFAQTRGGVEEIMKIGLMDDDWAVRKEAVEGLSFLKTMESTNLLLEIMDDSVSLVRVCALRALAGRKDSRIRSLMELLRNDSDVEVAGVASSYFIRRKMG